MTKNRLLNVAILICKSFRLIYIILFMIVTGFFIHFQINPSAYKKFNFNDFSIEKNTDLKFKFETKSKFSMNNDKVLEDNEIYKIDKLTTASSFFLYIEIAFCMILSFLCLKEFQNVLESVKGINTFQERNIISFRKIGKYLSVIFILSSYSWLNFKNGDITSFSFSITLPCLIILSFIMAEIFKEGNMLSEEVNLTV
jgi:hypothetical protein